MAKEPYSCFICKQIFTRKFNAERHNSKVHNGIAVIFNKETDWISDKRDLATSSSNVSAKPEIKKPTPKLESDKDATTNSILNSNHNNLRTLQKEVRIRNRLDKNEENEKMVFKIIGKLSPYIDITDSVIIKRHRNSREKSTSCRINNFFFGIFRSITFIKEQIEFHRSLIAMRRAISLTAQYYNIQPAKAKETLKALVLNSPYIKNKVNLRK